MERNFVYNEIPMRFTTDENNEVWVVGVDVCNILGYADAHQRIKSLDEDEFRLDRVRDGQGKKTVTLTVNESGLYSLILTSKKPEAKPFKRWITHEVLPSIRKSGSYTTEQAIAKQSKLKEFRTKIDEKKQTVKLRKSAIREIETEISKLEKEFWQIFYADTNQLSLYPPEVMESLKQ